ncbi:restriction endonuclease PLD domain-containing protein [Dawidia soli]|uniref:Uncharacterized protein n=1 Tax=Dawidia soli TaxID=2782352 RepID=A0AAP2D9S6_9BACT|nr:restriction endonuclease PLD domain-containing protein [Dawidia soli]MBT1688053.1 hypothetical protein [Dawidia soli]
MLVKKLAVPLINGKILAEAQHVYIATAAISQAGFDFINSRIPPKCKIEIVTGFDVLTSVQVLRRLWKHYQDRITLSVYTKNFFHPNLYIFDLPFRKSVAFVGSGHFTLGGIKDHEEIFFRVDDQKEIEALKSWFTGYYEFAEPLTENLLREYESIYPALKQREIASRRELDQALALTTAGFQWDSIRFKTQYFKKEDFLTFDRQKALLATPEVQAERQQVLTKLSQLYDALKPALRTVGLAGRTDVAPATASLLPAEHPYQKLRSLWLDLAPQPAPDGLYLRLTVGPQDVSMGITSDLAGTGKADRQHFHKQLYDPGYRSAFLQRLAALGPGYTLECAGVVQPVESFQQADVLWEFLKADEEMYFPLIISRSYGPGDPAVGTDKITTTITQALDALTPLYRHIVPAASSQ